MEHKKSGIENMKVLFGDFLDEINGFQSEMSDKMDTLLEQMEWLKKEIVRYQIRVKELEQLLMEAGQRSVAAEEGRPEPASVPEFVPEPVSISAPDSVLAPDSVPMPDSVPASDSVSVPEFIPVPDSIPAIEFEPLSNDQPQGESDAGFLLDVEEVEPAPEPASGVTPLPQERKPTSTEDLFSQPEALTGLPPERSTAFRRDPQSPSAERGERQIILEAARPDWYDWEVDYPAPYLENIVEGIGFNDRILFLKELFEGDEALFRDVVMRLNKMELFSDAVEYLRLEFPLWNEQSDEVYRFYMNVRRKLRK